MGTVSVSRTECVDNAVELARCGFAVFPVKLTRQVHINLSSTLDDQPSAVEQAQIEKKLNKVPLTSKGFHDASNDPDTVREMFERVHLPDDAALGIGLVPGKSNLVVIDLDITNDINGVDVARDKLGLTAEMTYSVQTPTGGQHLYFKKTETNKAISNVVPKGWLGIDVRGDNGFVVAPGSETTLGSWEVLHHGKGYPAEPGKHLPVLTALTELPVKHWKLLVETKQKIDGEGWEYYKAEHHAHLLNSNTLFTLNKLVRQLGVAEDSLTIHFRPDAPPMLRMTRPGKQMGVSAQLGGHDPSDFICWSSNWPPFVAGKTYHVDELDRIFAPNIDREAKLLQQVEELLFRDEVKRRYNIERLRQLSELAPNSLHRADTLSDVKAVSSASPLWGNGEQIAWMGGQSLMFAGDSGAGKTTLALQVVRAYVGGQPGVVTDSGQSPLGFDLIGPPKKVLYICNDRIWQVKVMMEHLLDDLPNPNSVRVKLGPPDVPFLDSYAFVQWVLDEYYGVTCVVLDSIKDMLPNPNDADMVFQYNMTRQMLLAHGVDVIEIHHLRKNGNGKTKKEDAEPNSIDDVLGSSLITAGSGSVFLMTRDSGGLVKMTHVKTPQKPLPPMFLDHDYDRWTTHVHIAPSKMSALNQTVIDAITQAGATGLTVAQIVAITNVSQAQVYRCLRLAKDSLVKQGTAYVLKTMQAAGPKPDVPPSGVVPYDGSHGTGPQQPSQP